MSSLKAYKGRSNDLQFHLIVGFIIRFLCVVYGEHHDQLHSVKFTDIDYHVFTDAAREVSNGGSPFDRHTYRYTPFLAWMLLPNIHYHFLFGKLLFCFFDCFATKLIYQILLQEGQPKSVALKSSFLWLYNPLVIVISSRGSAEAVMGVIVLILIYLLKLRLPLLSGIMLGLAIHFKLYPIIYCLPIYLSFSSESSSLIKKFFLSPSKIKLVIGTVGSFFCFTWFSYCLYGEQYIEESFLYHITRSDVRHNFSVYFYLLYLSADLNITGLQIAAFAPQFVLLIAIGCKYCSRYDLSFGLFSQTLVFVTFNKVVTSQYFLWYVLLLPLVYPRLGLSIRKSLLLVTLWFGAQASWLLPAYLLEFHSLNAFVPIWLEGIAFFCCNIGILMALVSSYNMAPLHQTHPTRKNR